MRNAHFWREYFLTPDEAPDDLLCRSFSLPNDPLWLGQFQGALWALTRPENWKQFGDVTPEDAAQAYTDIIDAALPGTLNECPSSSVPAPYWDDAEDSDDQLPDDDQPWYGYVTDPEAPPDELTFVESAAIWAFTGFIAFATLEVGAYPAVVFNTLAQRWVLAFKKEDLGEVIRVIVDAVEVDRVDTSEVAEGEIIRVRIVGDPDQEIHTIQLVQVA